MTAASMKGKCRAAISALGDPEEFDTPQEFAEAAMQALCQGIIEEITQNAVVAVTVASVAGVTVGAGVSGPGTGNGSIS